MGICVVKGCSNGIVLSPIVKDTVGLVRVGKGTSYNMFDINLQKCMFKA